MLKVHNLTPDGWLGKNYWTVEGRVTMIGDFTWFYDIPFNYDESANLCEFECHFFNSLSDDFANIDWDYLKKNKSKKLIITHRIFKNLTQEAVNELNNYIYEFDCKDRVWFFTFNPKEFRFKKSANFRLAYLNSITTVKTEAAFLFLNKQRRRQVSWSDIVPNSRNEMFYPDQVDFSQSDKYFNFLAHRVTNHRLFAYHKLLQKNLANRGITNFHAYETANIRPPDYRAEFLNHENTLKSLDINIDDLMSYISKPQTTDHAMQNSEGVDEIWEHMMHKASYSYIHSKSLLSISNETSAISTDEIYVTEKTFLNYALGRPFLINGNKDSLKWLNRYFGFQSFNSLFDESYDDIDNYLERSDFIINELDKFCSLSFSKAKEKITDLKHIFDHNRQIYMSIPHRNLFMRIFDGI